MRGQDRRRKSVGTKGESGHSDVVMEKEKEETERMDRRRIKNTLCTGTYIKYSDPLSVFTLSLW